jgi:hypothetical protein
MTRDRGDGVRTARVDRVTSRAQRIVRGEEQQGVRVRREVTVEGVGGVVGRDASRSTRGTRAIARAEPSEMARKLYGREREKCPRIEPHAEAENARGRGMDAAPGRDSRRRPSLRGKPVRANSLTAHLFNAAILVAKVCLGALSSSLTSPMIGTTSSSPLRPGRAAPMSRRALSPRRASEMNCGT